MKYVLLEPAPWHTTVTLFLVWACAIVWLWIQTGDVVKKEIGGLIKWIVIKVVWLAIMGGSAYAAYTYVDWADVTSSSASAGLQAFLASFKSASK